MKNTQQCPKKFILFPFQIPFDASGRRLKVDENDRECRKCKFMHFFCKKFAYRKALQNPKFVPNSLPLTMKRCAASDVLDAFTMQGVSMVPSTPIQGGKSSSLQDRRCFTPAAKATHRPAVCACKTVPVPACMIWQRWLH